MPMVGAALGVLMKSKVDAAVAGLASPIGQQNPAMRDAIYRALGEAIVEYIQTNATVAVASVSGVTPGGGVSGPGTGVVL